MYADTDYTSTTPTYSSRCTVVSLSPRQSLQFGPFGWNPDTSGNYYVWAEVLRVTPYEDDMADNFHIDGTVTVRSEGVGGFWVPVDKFGLLAPYIGLASTIVVATVATAIYVKRVKRRKERQ